MVTLVTCNKQKGHKYSLIVNIDKSKKKAAIAIIAALILAIISNFTNKNKMTTHTGRSYMNSCLKTPLDPCNNCPAPIYNRPKMYLGRLSSMSNNNNKLTTTANTTTTVVDSTVKDTEQETAITIGNCSGGLRYLAKFYDSIPGTK